MKVAPEYFNTIAAGKKTIESRLYDSKRQQISMGDIILFCENDTPENTVSTMVMGLLRYQTFKELFADHNPACFWVESREQALVQIRRFYSQENEQKYGVIGIRFSFIDL